MSSIQRRIKNLYQIPSIHTIETQPQLTSVIDPRSPSANITRTPVDLQTYHLPIVSNKNIK